jgi:hypothetical protein
MASVDRTHVRRRLTVAIAAAAAVAALTLAGAAPVRAQAPSCTPGLLFDFCSDVPATLTFVLDKGVYATLAAPGASATLPFGINNRGQIVGAYVDPDGGTAGGFTHGFLFEDGVFSTIDVPGPGPSETELTGISNSGEIAGVYRDALGITLGFHRAWVAAQHPPAPAGP